LDFIHGLHCVNFVAWDSNIILSLSLLPTQLSPLSRFATIVAGEMASSSKLVGFERVDGEGESKTVNKKIKVGTRKK
jgi:hypothetical protein